MFSRLKLNQSDTIRVLKRRREIERDQKFNYLKDSRLPRRLLICFVHLLLYTSWDDNLPLLL